MIGQSDCAPSALPHLVHSVGIGVELVGSLDHDIGRASDQIMGLQRLTTSPIRPFARADSKFSPRIGIVLKPTDEVSLYGSYARSFQPRSGDQSVEG